MDIDEIKRKKFRVSLKGNKAVSVKINNVPYEAVDLNDGGIGLRLGAEDIFVAVGDELVLEMQIQNLSQTIRGKVVHVSPAEADEFHCGVQFISIDEKSREKLLHFLEACREKIFKED